MTVLYGRSAWGFSRLRERSQPAVKAEYTKVLRSSKRAQLGEMPTLRRRAEGIKHWLDKAQCIPAMAAPADTTETDTVGLR